MNRSNTQAFLSGGGEVGALMRAHDWSTSPLGPPDTWSQSLRTVVGLLLNSKFPMFVAWGSEFGFLYNDAYSEILGDKHPSALGRRFEDIWFEIWGDVSPIVAQAMDGKATYHENLPLIMQRKGYAEPTWFTFSYSPVRDESGTIAGIYCACTETTEQVRAERVRLEENERLRRLFEQAPGVMAVFQEPDHVFELANAAYLQLVGNRELLGRPIREVLPELQGQGFFELLDHVYTSGEPHVGHAASVKLQRQSGELEERFVDYVFQPIKNAADQVTGIFVEGNDVTGAINANNELRAANRRKDEFLAMLAHELRNPLAPISVAAELLKLTGPDAEQVRLTSDIITRQVEHMTALVDDLLDVSRVTRGLVALKKEVLNINDVVAGAIEQIRSLIELKQQHLVVHVPTEPPFLEGDRTRLIQVFANILNNAAKYTPEHGHVTVKLDVQQDRIEFSALDDGQGIAPDLLPHVFDLFTQAERSPDRSQGGLGLGLALAKGLAELHGGSVSAHSEGSGKGSKFTVRLPRLIEAPPVLEQQDATTDLLPADGAMRLMVVDDNTDAAKALCMLLEAIGHQVTAEHSALRALERARHQAPQMLFIDIGLPDLDGYELVRRLRKMPETSDSVFVAVTGYGQPKDKQRAKDAGFDHHIVKPLKLAALLGLLGDYERSRPQ